MIARFLLISSLVASTGLFAQRYGKRTGENKKYTSYGIALNAMNYVGELDPGPSFLAPSIRFTKPSLSLTIAKRIKPAITLRAALTYGRIKGDDYISADHNGKNFPRKIRNLNFRSDIFELKGDLVFDLIPHYLTYQKRHELVPYGFVGAALFHHDPYGQIPKGFEGGGTWIKLRPLKTEGRRYSSFQAAIPFGLGIRYKLAENWDLAFEVGWRFTFTDYLDDVSSSYGDPMQMSPTARLMAFKSSYVVSDDPNMQSQLYSVLDPNGVPIYLPGGVPLQTLTSYAGEYVYKEGSNGTQKVWQSDVMRGDRNKDWYIVSGIHLTFIPPFPDYCPKFRYNY